MIRSRLRATYNPYRNTMRFWKGLAALGVVFLLSSLITQQHQQPEILQPWIWWSASAVLAGGLGWAATLYLQHRAWRSRHRLLDEATRQRVQGLLKEAIEASSTEGVGAIKAAFDQGADPTLLHASHTSMLVHAVRSGTPAAVQMILESGFDVEKMQPAEALLEAMARNDEASTQWLLRVGVNPYDTTKEGVKPVSRLWDEQAASLAPRVWIMLWSYLEWADQQRVDAWLNEQPAGRRDHLKSLMDLASGD